MNPPSHKSVFKKILLVGLPILAVVLIGIVVVTLVRNDFSPEETGASTASTDSTSQLSNLRQSSRNSARRLDVNSLATGVGEYVSNHNGVLPKSISAGSADGEVYICGSSCDDTVPTVVTLTAFENPAQKISIVPFADSRSVTDTERILIVTGATCADEMTAVAGNSREVAFLFANLGSEPEPQCIPL